MNELNELRMIFQNMKQMNNFYNLILNFKLKKN